MKLRWQCGNLIADNTDYLSHKGHLIADEDWEEFLESALPPDGPDWRLSQIIYQCPKCGRIHFEKEAGKGYFFVPESADAPKDLLGSIKRSSGN